MTATTTPAPNRSTTRADGFHWPTGFQRIPDEDWTRQPVDEFGLSYDLAGQHSWYKNLDPTISQVIAGLDENRVMVDYSSGTGLVTKRLLNTVKHSVGIVNVDASPKFLRVALENFADDERVAFRLLNFDRETKHLQTLDEVIDIGLVERGVDLITAANAIHLYYNLDETLRSWAKVLRPGGLVSVCSGNLNNPARRPGDWIIDDTVAAVNEVVIDLVNREPSFAKYRDVLADPHRMAKHTTLREKVFVPVRPLDTYLQAFESADFQVMDVFETTIFAKIDEWFHLLRTYHDGVLSWVGGSQKIDGHGPDEEALRDRLFLIRYGLEKLFPGETSFPCTWTYMTCRRR